MTLPTHQQVDTWHATVWNLLHTTTGSLYDLIDLGPADVTVTARQPSRAEKQATDRADGNFHPTTKSQGHRRTGHSDPVGRQVEAWEAEAQQRLSLG